MNGAMRDTSLPLDDVRILLPLNNGLRPGSPVCENSFPRKVLREAG